MSEEKMIQSLGEEELDSVSGGAGNTKTAFFTVDNACIYKIPDTRSERKQVPANARISTYSTIFVAKDGTRFFKILDSRIPNSKDCYIPTTSVIVRQV